MKFLKTITLQIKEKKYRMLNPASVFIYKKLGIKSNHLTLLSFLSGLLAFYFLFYNTYAYLIFIILTIVFDIFDGSVARLENKQGKCFNRGMLFDDLSDRLITLLILFKITIFLPNPALPAILLIYIVLKGMHIYLKQITSKPIYITFIDRIPLILFVFSLYNLGLALIGVSLILNTFELAFIIKKLYSNK